MLNKLACVTSFYWGGLVVAATVIYSNGAPGLAAILEAALWPVDVVYFWVSLVLG